MKTTAYVPPEHAKTAPAIDSGQGHVARPKSRYGNGEGSPEQIILPPPPDRASLTVSAWLDKDIPERDFLLGGGVMCTTWRWFIFGETGIGKTLIAMETAAQWR